MKTIIETIHGNTRHAAPREFAGEAEEFDRDKGIKSNVQIRLIEIIPLTSLRSTKKTRPRAKRVPSSEAKTDGLQLVKNQSKNYIFLYI